MKKIMAVLVSILLLMGTACDRKSFDEADIIENTHGDVANGDRLYQFYENTVNGQEDSVRVITYTTEGDPIYQDLTYDVTGIESVEDAREDEFGSGEVVTRQCNSIVVLTSETELVYVLEGCDPEDGMNTILIETE
ncbi:DUF4362 domain-containing protein [uncultured Planococcus sp.]|uniref:DUF4362 domain-containing protein n=1 Tax=uncultured Planococcus sp. TaxID=337815 RepID=UPI00261EA8BD|nr:DUF4362 domain-containing protein [uncultured Planococcus sp.]